MSASVDPILSKLEKLDGGNPVESAVYREQAQELLANPNVALKVRTAIADLLLYANRQLMLNTVRGDDSY